MGRYYGSEAMRDPKLQKKAIDYALDKLNPMIQDVGSQALNQLSTKIRPKKKYKTNRKDLDGGSLDIHNAIGTVVEHLSPTQASHQCGPGSIPGLGVICGLSLLLVLVLAPRGFSPGTPVFPSPQKPTFPNSDSIWNPRATSLLV